MKRPEVNIIVAVAPDMAIGRGGDLLFHVSDDLKRFKELTMGHPIIMGRKTFESLPKGALPGRRNIVISRNKDFKAEGAETVGSIDEAITLCTGAEKVFIIGGAQIYAAALPVADRMMLTRFDRSANDADCFFPEIDETEWLVTEKSEPATDPKSGVNYHFETLVRKTDRD